MPRPIALEVTKEMDRPRFAESARKEGKGNGDFKTRSPTGLIAVDCTNRDRNYRHHGYESSRGNKTRRARRFSRRSASRASTHHALILIMY